MDETRKEWYRSRLLARREEIRSRLRAMEAGGQAGSQREALAELSAYDNHPADLGTSTAVRAQEVAFRDGARRGLERVEAALERLDRGTYGICLACGGPVGAERLAALPEAELCAACAERTSRGPAGRPVEEEALSPPFGRTFTDGGEEVGYDGEDAWQDAARAGTSETPSDVPPERPRPLRYPDVYTDAGERVGAVEDAELLAGGDEGPRGPGGGGTRLLS